MRTTMKKTAAYLLALLLVSLSSRRAVQPTIRNMEQQKQFITNAGHELKTPLTVISTNMELLNMELPDNPWVHSTQKQTAVLRRLVDELVYLSRMEEENPAMAMESLSLGELLEETAGPFTAMAEFGGNVLGGRARAEAADLLKRTAASALVAGGDDGEILEGGEKRMYNAAALYTPDGGVQVYRKQHLVPFGECIPLDKWIPVLQKLSPIGVSLHPGEPRLVQFAYGGDSNSTARLVRVAPLICFEDTVPTLSRQAAKNGAQAIVLIINDSWFSNSNEAAQHAAQAVLRAIETGVPVVRTGNSGVSGVINPDGTAHWFLGDDGKPIVDEAGAQIDMVHPATDATPTMYVQLGDWPLAIASLLVLALLFRRVRDCEPTVQNQPQAA